MPYTYDLMGNMTSSTLPWWSAFTYKYNTAARLTEMDSSVGSPASFLSGATYNAAGQIVSDTLGTLEAESFAYDKRLRLQSESSTVISTGAQDYSFSLNFAPNGDVVSANDSVNGNWNYSYDQFNRLVCANLASNGTCATPPSGTPTYTYVYDRFGNRWQQNGQYSMQLAFTGNNPSTPANNNRMDGYSYDAAGNLIYDGTHQYFYDAENRLIQVDGRLPYCTSNGTSGSAATACYYYDAEGHRVYRTGPSFDGFCTGYTFDLQGRPVGEYDNNTTGYPGNICSTEIYLGSRHLVTYAEGVAYFDHTDWLGTSRVRNRASYPFYNQNCTSLPFGDGLTCTSTSLYELHFTGKERDFETGLDNFGARYDSSNLGRFMTPDWSVAPTGVPYADFGSPQSLNLYSFGNNNPETYVDRGGHCIEDACIIEGGIIVAVAVVTYATYKLNQFFKKRQKVDNDAFQKGYDCAFYGKCTTEQELRRYDKERLNDYGEGAIQAITNTMPSATPPTEIKDAIIDELKDRAADKMVDSAKETEEEREKRGAPLPGHPHDNDTPKPPRGPKPIQEAPNQPSVPITQPRPAPCINEQDRPCQL